MPNYRRYYLEGHPVFLTLVTHERRPWLAEHSSIETLLGAMRWAKTQHPYRHIAHVILHDHLHWMLLPDDGVRFSAVVGALKRDVTWRLKRTGVSGPLWQKRFFDHVIRDPDDFRRHLDYVHFNPVRHGYVRQAIDYGQSSFRTWVERGVYSADWGTTEPTSIGSLDLE